ncbi:MAG: hypothetical protein M5R36_13580 [Deltaproteobacteria bacterium]|nr:hypothetical protein [Deltaproteobacteria bacterium]
MEGIEIAADADDKRDGDGGEAEKNPKPTRLRGAAFDSENNAGDGQGDQSGREPVRRGDERESARDGEGDASSARVRRRAAAHGQQGERGGRQHGGEKRDAQIGQAGAEEADAAAGNFRVKRVRQRLAEVGPTRDPVPAEKGDDDRAVTDAASGAPAVKGPKPR